MRGFFYQGTLYRYDCIAMQYYRKIRQGHWEWTPVRGYWERKIRRIIKRRESSPNGQYWNK